MHLIKKLVNINEGLECLKKPGGIAPLLAAAAASGFGYGFGK